jgi:hypothetical protein
MPTLDSSKWMPPRRGGKPRRGCELPFPSNFSLLKFEEKGRLTGFTPGSTCLNRELPVIMRRSERTTLDQLVWTRGYVLADLLENAGSIPASLQ